MTKSMLGSREAAAVIQADVMKDLSLRMNPEDAHGVIFLKEVCGHLGIEATPENISTVAMSLREHDIGIHAGHEYPKWVEKDGKRVIVQSREEEDEFMADDDIEDGEYDTGDEVDHGKRTADVLKAPPYEPNAGSREPGAPNRPTEPAPVASPVSDAGSSDATTEAGTPVVEENANDTPNPQPVQEQAPVRDFDPTPAPAPPRRPK